MKALSFSLLTAIVARSAAIRYRMVILPFVVLVKA